MIADYPFPMTKLAAKSLATLMLFVGLASCGVSGQSNSPESERDESSSVTSSTLSLADYAAKYQELMAPVASANEDAMQRSLGASSESGVEAASKDFAKALETFNESALRIDWPEPVRTSMRNLIDANNAWIATSQLWGTMSMQSVLAKSIEARGKIKSATSMVEADLGIL